MNDRRLDAHHKRWLGDLAVRCWCQARIVTVPQAEVRAGLTRACGRGCAQMGERIRAELEAA